MIKVKICGIKTVEEALCTISACADFIGLNFVRDSKRFIDFEQAKSIVAEVRSNGLSNAKIVGVFQNNSFDYVNLVSDNLKLDYIQLHGDECVAYVALMHRPVIKAFLLPSDFDLTNVMKRFKQFDVDYFLVDRERQGSGEMLNLEKVDTLCKHFPIIFSGGLTAENLKSVMKIISPDGVDVASGIETENLIDCQKIYKFIRVAKNY